MLKSECCEKDSDSMEFHFKESFFECLVGVLFILSGRDKKKNMSKARMRATCSFVVKVQKERNRETPM